LFAKGYGAVSVNGVKTRAHRLAYELSNGPIPAGKMILHSCDNRRCVNPAHLRPGTAQENWEDALTRGRLTFREQPRRFDRDDPRVWEGTLKQAGRALGVSHETIRKCRLANQSAR
jgi:hypothetical protein